MIFVFVVSLLIGKGSVELLTAWWNGLSSQFTLAFQMSLMVIVCATAARSPQSARLLSWIAKKVSSRTGALLLLMIFGYVTSMLNWAFCTIVTPILAMHLAKKIKGLHFPMMVAGGYACMILGQCLGPSATLYSTLATEGSTYAEIVGQSMSVAETCYNPVNVILWIILAVVFILLVLFTRPGKDELVELGDIATQLDHIAMDTTLTDEERRIKLEQMADNEVRRLQELNKLESEEKELFGFDLSNYTVSKEIQEAESPFR